MKGVPLREFRQPIALAEVPEPELVGPKDVLITVGAAGVCYKDLLIVAGFQPRVKLPMVLGHEAAGRVAAVGAEVTEYRVGDRVCALGYVSCGSCASCRAGSEHLCRNRQWLGEDLSGGYGQVVRSHVNSIARIPDSVSDEAAAAATCAMATVVHGLKRLGNLQQGETVLVTGAAGAVGSNAILAAKAMGARVMATAAGEKAGLVTGADTVLPFGDDLAARIKKLTGGEGVDLVVESVGTPAMDQSLKALKWGGRIVVIGNVRPADTLPLALGGIILREVAILGCMNGTRADLAEALRLMDVSGLVPPTPTTLPLSEAQHAHDLLREKKSVGKIILKP